MTDSQSRPIFLDTSRLTALGGSFWYLLSAGLMLWGIGLILLPAFETTGSLAEKLIAIAAMNLYQWLLLALIVVLAIWRTILDDAVLLTLLEVAFTVAIAAALDTVAASLPVPVVVVGLGLMVLALLKLELLGRRVIAQPSTTQLIAMSAVMAINFLLPGAMGLSKTLEASVTPEHLATVHIVMRLLIEAGWLVFLLAGIAMALELEWRPAGAVHRADLGRPALSSPTMRWLVTFVMLSATAGHLCALAWSFGLDVTLADTLAPIVLSAVLIITLARGYGFQNQMPLHAALTTVIVVAVHCSASGAGHTDPLRYFSTANPTVALAILAAAMLAIGLARRSDRMIEWTVGLSTLAILLSTADPQHRWAGHIGQLAWFEASLLATLGLALLAAWRLKLRHAAAAIVTGAAAIGFAPVLQDWPLELLVHPAQGWITLLAASFLVLQAVGDRLARSPALITWGLAVAWTCLVMADLATVADGISQLPGAGRFGELSMFPLALAGGIYLVIPAVISRRYYVPVLALPLLGWAAFLSDVSVAWLLIFLSFAALAIGALFSLRKAPDENPPALTHPVTGIQAH